MMNDLQGHLGGLRRVRQRRVSVGRGGMSGCAASGNWATSAVRSSHDGKRVLDQVSAAANGRSFVVTNRSVLAIAVPMTLAYLTTPLLGVV
ncbi:MAG: hypothetical protein EOQ80_12795, partial [Mesorhizobium sp.]